MRKLLSLFMLSLLVMTVTLMAINTTNTEGDLGVITKDGSAIVAGMFDVGFVPWLKGNYFTFIFFLFGVAAAIVAWTPSPKDDAIMTAWLKPIWKGLNFLAQNYRNAENANTTNDPEK